MKVYAVVCRDAAWHATIPGTGQKLGSYEDKSVIVGWTRAFARKHDGEVHVHDERGRIEAVYSYLDGMETLVSRPIGKAPPAMTHTSRKR